MKTGMEAEADPDSSCWETPRRIQRQLFRALPLGRKLAIAADLADLVRAFERRRPSSARRLSAPQDGRAAEISGLRVEASSSLRLAGLDSFRSRLRAACLTAFLAVALTGPAWAASEAKPGGPTSATKARVMRFVHVPEVWDEQGPRPKNVWIYGRFTARTPVSDGLFLASVNEGINWPDWEENFNLIDNPGNYVFRRVVFQTKTPLPTIRKGTKFSIPKDHPARLVEIDRVDGVITRMVLESPPIIESQEGAGRRVSPGSDPAPKASASERPRRVVYFNQLGSIARQEGVHPENVWTWGNFSARSDLRDGIVTATPAGVESRRVLEWIAGAVLIYPIVEVPSRAILYVHQPRRIRNGDRIVITPKHPARVKRLFLAGGVLVWLDLDPPQSSEPQLQLGSVHSAAPTPAPAPSPERLAAGSP